MTPRPTKHQIEVLENQKYHLQRDAEKLQNKVQSLYDEVCELKRERENLYNTHDAMLSVKNAWKEWTAIDRSGDDAVIRMPKEQCATLLQLCSE